MIFKGESRFKDKHLTENFTVGEIICKDGSKEYIINSDVLEGLEKLRKIIGKPIIINSGYRSEMYNKKVGGAGDSQHCKGNAIDFHVKELNTEQIYEVLKNNNFLGKIFTGVGLYDDWVHVDVRTNPNQRGFSFWDNRKK